MKSKYFDIRNRVIWSKESVNTIDEAWEKTLEKWALVMDGYRPASEGATCGLCNYVDEVPADCYSCPVYKVMGNSECTPFGPHENDLEYLYLLIIKEAYYSEWDE